MHLAEHEKECREKLGEAFTEVHRFLDSLFRYHGVHHRRKLHHKRGVEVVRRHYGNLAAKAAELHIKSDLQCDDIPENESDFVNRGYL